MNRNSKGFSLVELLITMVIFVLFMTAASTVFTNLLTQFKQQSRLAETNIEGIIGLELFRQDIDAAGYGLPWNVAIAGNDWGQLYNYYKETESNPFSLNDAPTSPPRAILSKNNATFSGENSIFNGTDYIVIKSATVARNGTSEKWTTLSAKSPYTRKWTTAHETDPISENLQLDDKVIVISPAGRFGALKELVVVDKEDGKKAFFTTFSNVTNFKPEESSLDETDIVYGIHPPSDFDLRMPFNRADYFILKSQGDNNIVPKRCAPNTGVLVKAVVKHSDGEYDYQPLLDCVADMQVVFGLDTNADGAFDPAGGDSYSEDITTLTAENIREQLKQVRVYILAHEGQKDNTFIYPSSTVSLGADVSLGREFNLASKIGNPEYKNYRWKVYTIVTTPKNLE